MAVQKIGLEAVLEMGSFSANLKGYISGINQMERATDSAAASASNSGKAFSNFGVGVAAGIGAAIGSAAISGLKAAIGLIGDLGKQALDSVGSFEMMGLAFNNMVARDLARGKLRETTTETTIGLTEKEATEYENLSTKIEDQTAARKVLSSQIEVQAQKVAELDGANKELGQARLEKMRLDYDQTGEAITKMYARQEELTKKSGEAVTVTQWMRGEQMSLTEAREAAIPIVQELLKWTQQVAIQSPFTQEGVAGTFRLAQSYGFAAAAAYDLATGQAGIAEAQQRGIMTAERLTQDIIDFTAGSGQSEEVAKRVALALGQIQARGKLAGQEVMQLTEAGISVDQILSEAFGKSRQEIVEMREAGLIPADKAIEAIAQSLEKDYGGAAKRATGTISGLMSSLEDIKSIGLRELFTATFDALKPLVGGFVDLAASNPEAAFAPLRAIGKQVGESIAQIVTRIQELIGAFQAGGLSGLATALGIPPDVLTGISTLTTTVSTLAATISGVLMTAFDWLNTTGFPMMRQALDFVIQNWDTFQGALIAIGATLSGMAIIGTIAATIAALSNPISLVIIAAGLLGAAWNANWYGMRDTLTAFWTGTALPALQQLWTWLQTNLPIAIAYLSNLWTNTLLPALQAGGNFMLTVVVPAIQQMYSWLAQNLPIAIAAASAFITGTLIPALQQAWSWLSTNIPSAISTVIGLWGSFTATIQSVSDFINGTVIPAFNSIVATINSVLTPALQANSAFWGMVGAAINSVATWINAYLMPAFTALGGFISAVFNLALTALAGLLQNVVMPAFTALGAFIQSVMQPILTTIGTALTSVATALGLIGVTTTETTNPAIALLGTALNTVANIVTNVLGLALQLFIANTLTQFQAGLQGIQNALTFVTDKLNGLTGALNSVTLPDWLQPGSPTPFEIGLRGIADILGGKLSKALDEFGGIAPPIFAGLADSVTLIKTNLAEMAEGTLAQFSAAMGSAGSAMVSNFEEANSYAERLADTLDDLRSSLSSVSGYAQSAGSSFSSFNDAAGNIYGQLIPALQSLVEWLNQVADAASAAASNVGDVGSSAGGAGGPGFQHGANFIVPSGFSNDSFPFRAETGERVIVMPRPLANQPVAAAGGGVGGVNLIFENVTITTGMDLEMFGAFVERRVARAMGGA